MRDEQELGLLSHALDHRTEALGIGIVKRRIHLVEHDERQGAHGKHAQEQCHTRQCALAAGEERELLPALERRTRIYLDAGATGFPLIGEPELGVASAEEELEVGGKGGLQRGELLREGRLDEGVQLHGGYGYMTEYPIARAYVDARITKIFAGTNEIMKEIIGRGMDLG